MRVIIGKLTDPYERILFKRKFRLRSIRMNRGFRFRVSAVLETDKSVGMTTTN